MIGGADIILGGSTREDDADFLLRGIRSEWPGAFVQGADEPHAIPIRDLRFPLHGQTEIFVYRDEASYRSWQTDGATTENEDAMIQVIVADDSVTLVVDRQGSNLASLADDLLASLSRNRMRPTLQPTHLPEAA